MWEQELGELSAIKLTCVCLIKKNKQQPGGHWQDWSHAGYLIGLKSGASTKPRKGKGAALGLETGSSPTNNVRNHLDLSGLYPFSPSGTIQGYSYRSQ